MPVVGVRNTPSKNKQIVRVPGVKVDVKLFTALSIRWNVSDFRSSILFVSLVHGRRSPQHLDTRSHLTGNKHVYSSRGFPPRAGQDSREGVNFPHALHVAESLKYCSPWREANSKEFTLVHYSLLLCLSLCACVCVCVCVQGIRAC